MPPRPIEFTLTCAAGVNPYRVRVDEVSIEGPALLACRVGTTNVFRGQLMVNIVAPVVSLTAMAVGRANVVSTCNFSYRSRPFYPADKPLRQEQPGRYRYYNGTVQLP